MSTSVKAVPASDRFQRRVVQLTTSVAGYEYVEFKDSEGAPHKVMAVDGQSQKDIAMTLGATHYQLGFSAGLHKLVKN